MMKSKRFRALLKRRRLSKPEEVREEEEGPSPYRAVIIGYGPIGRTLVRLLLENEVEPSIIDLNFEAVQSAKRHGIPAVYGDATQPDTLREAETHLAGTLILSSSNLTGSAEVIRLARQMNPKIRVLARVGYVAELKAIKQAGADVVFSGEGEVSLALTTAVLRQLGAGGEQIDRERERVRKELVDLQTSDEGAATPAGK
jgi:CPA2 family monovalent cation:H+ antiporter-2